LLDALKRHQAETAAELDAATCLRCRTLAFWASFDEKAFILLKK
jgi:hypothetical protein